MNDSSHIVRTLLVLLGLACVGWLGWWVFQAESPEVEVEAVSVTVADPAPSAAADLAAGAAGAAAPSAADLPRRDAAPEGPDREAAPPDPAGPILLVHVVAKETGDPLPGAEVFLVEPEELDPEDQALAQAGDEDLEELFRRLGRRRVADASGDVRIPRVEGAAFVLAGAAPGRFDVGFGYDPNEDEVTLELSRRNEVVARVVDGAGRPVAGMTVALRRRLGATSADFFQESSDEDGLASFLLPGAILDEGANTEYALGLSIVGGDPVEVPLDLAALPSEPIRLVVPDDVGRVEVYVVEEDGRAPTVPTQVGLRPLDGEEEGPGAVRRVTMALLQDGRAVFEGVRTGTRLHVEAGILGGERRAEREGYGPETPGATARFDLVLREERPILVGRILNEEGRPGKGVRLETHLEEVMETGSSSIGGQVKCDAEGRFRIVLQNPYREGSTRTLRLVVPARRGKPERDVVVDLSRSFPPGENELGDLVVRPAPLLASGRVVDPQGNPVGGAQVHVESFSVHGPTADDGAWFPIARIQAETDAEGRFELRGRVEGRLRVVATHPAFMAGDAEIVPGTRDVVLRLSPARELLGRVLLPDGIDPHALILSFVPAERGEDGAVPFRLDADGSFRRQGLPPGGGELVLSCRWTDEELARRTIGPAGDQEVVLDLRGLPLTTLDLRVRNADGSRPNFWWLHPAGAQERRTYVSEAEVQLVTLAPGFDLVLGGDGTREVRLSGVSGEREVLFQDGFEIVLAVAPVPDLPEGTQLVLQLYADEGQGATSGGAFVGQVQLDAAGRGSTQVGRSGRFLVVGELFEVVRDADAGIVAYTAARSLGRLGAIEVTEVAGVQEFSVALDPELVRQALEGDQE